jgi:hypothetical protein
MQHDWSEEIAREVLSWPGVTRGTTERGDVQFVYGRIELGHLHGASCADLPFPLEIRNALIAEGRASVHDPLPHSGWVRRRLHNAQDVQAVIALFRLNFERAQARATRHKAAKDSV